MKKLFVLFMSLAMLLGTVTGAAAQESSVQTVGATVLQELKAVDEAYLSSPESTVARGEFVSIFVNMMKASLGSGKTKYFMDVSGGSTYAKEIEYAATQGFVYSYGDGTFRPNQTITVLEACSIVLNAAGYYRLVEFETDRDSAYARYASDNKLINTGKYKYNTQLTRQALAELLYNAFDVKLVAITEVSGQRGATYEKTEETFLNHYLDMWETEGIVTQNRFTALDSPDGLTAGQIGLDGQAYDCTAKKADDYLGYRVKAYLTNEEDVVKVLVPFKNETVTIATEDLDKSKTTRTELCYENEKGKIKKQKIALDADIIYNGECDPNAGLEDFLSATGEIILLNNDSESEADVIFINDYKDIFVSSVSTGNNTINNRYTYDTAYQQIDLDDCEMVSVEKGGAVSSLGGIAKNNIASVRIPKSGVKQAVWIQVSDTTVSGTVTAVREEEHEITVNGTVYELAESYLAALAGKDAAAKEIKANYTGIFYLNFAGKIAAAETEDGTYKLGYMKKAVIYEDGENENGAYGQLRVLGFDRDWHTLYIGEKVRVNDVKVHAENILDTALFESHANPIPQVIQYKVNAKGFVAEVNTAIESDDYNSDQFRYTVIDNLTYRSVNKSFESDIYMSTSAITFFVPDRNGTKIFTNAEIANLDEDFFYAQSGGYSTTNYSGKAFNCDKYRVTDCVLRTGDISTMGEFNVGRFIFRSQTTTLDEEENGVTVLNGIHGTNLRASVNLRSDVVVTDMDGKTISVNDLSCGDVLSLYFDTNNKVHTIKTNYSVGAAGGQSKLTDSLNGNPVYLYGHVDDIDHGAGRMLINDGLERLKSIKIRSNVTSVYVYDAKAKGENRVRAGNINDIQAKDPIYMIGAGSSFEFIIVYKL